MLHLNDLPDVILATNNTLQTKLAALPDLPMEAHKTMAMPVRGAEQIFLEPVWMPVFLAHPLMICNRPQDCRRMNQAGRTRHTTKEDFRRSANALPPAHLMRSIDMLRCALSVSA